MLRNGAAKQDGSQVAEVLLVRRAKAPEIGKWTMPGGSLELGEEAGFSLELTPCAYSSLTAAAAAELLT
jgi:8-oxo-dGTP pyrophosphatase MutT (NUDIX family)